MPCTSEVIDARPLLGDRYRHEQPYGGGSRDERGNRAPPRPGPMRPSQPEMTAIEVDGVALGVEHFGDATAPLVLLAGGTTMLSWPDALCEELARGGRHVVRYDLRDSGASTTVDPEAPAYTLPDPPPTPRRSPASSMTARRTWRASASVGWSPRSPRSIIPARSRRSPWPAPARSRPARPTMTFLIMTRRR